MLPIAVTGGTVLGLTPNFPDTDALDSSSGDTEGNAEDCFSGRI
jgi:hypothetical protein